MLDTAMSPEELAELEEALRSLIVSRLDELDPPAAGEDVEILACAVAAPFDGTGVPAEVAPMLASCLAERDDEIGAGMLAALARMSGPALAAEAERARGRLAARGIVSPFDAQIGVARASEAYAATLAEGTAELIGLLLRRPGEEDVRALVVFLEHEDCGPVLTGMLVSERLAIAQARQYLRKPHEAIGATTAVPVDEVAGTVRAALEHMVAHEVPLGADEAGVLPLLVTALDGPGSDMPRVPGDVDSPEREAAELVDRFAAALDEQGAGDAGDAAFVAHLLLDWKLTYADGDLATWRPADLDEFLLDWYPRKGDADDESIAAVIPALRRFVTFMDAEGGLSGGARDLLAALDGIEPEFAGAARDPRLWGPAKALAARMRAEGLDPADPEALEAFIADFNARPLAERDAILGRGRSDVSFRGREPQGRSGPPPAERRGKRKAAKAARKRNRR